MGFRNARDRLVEALEEGRFEHEARKTKSEKNLLAVGDVSAERVKTLLHRCRGDQHEESPHYWDPETTVHEFEPVVDGESWYIKAYFQSDGNTVSATFISVHQ